MPRVELGVLMFCYGLYWGEGRPSYFAYCPTIRYRVTEKWAIRFDPAYASARYQDFKFGMVGLRPGVEYSFAQGTSDTLWSHGYAVAGFDAWMPTTGGERTPTIFLGGHLGVGAVLSWDDVGIGAELRGLVRAGLGNEDNADARGMSNFRGGFEIRFPTLTLLF